MAIYRGIINREIEIETASILLIVGTRHAGLPARRPSLHFNAASHSYETIRLCTCDRVGRVTCVVCRSFSPTRGRKMIGHDTRFDKRVL